MNRQFGALSGLAIVLIILNHAIGMGITPPQNMEILPITGWGSNLLSLLQALGVFAVPIFLFISGSFISYAARGEPPRLTPKFLITSFQHILLPYLFWSIMFYGLIYLHYEQTYSFSGYVKNLLIGYPFHFIPLLTFYYLISPLLVRAGKNHALLLLLVIGLYQLFLINVEHPGILGLQLPDWSEALTPPVLRSTMAEWAIFFPLGLIYGLHTKYLLPKIIKLRWIFATLVVIFFILALMDGVFKIINFPIARYLSMSMFIFIIPAIKRDAIPLVRQLERIGRRSYGIYLTHLIFIDLSLFLIQTTAGWLYRVHFIVPLILFIIGIILPLSLMELAARAPSKRYYRYVFG